MAGSHRVCDAILLLGSPTEARDRVSSKRAKVGGERGIRTPGTVSGSVVFKTTAIDHSAISPRWKSRAIEFIAPVDLPANLSRGIFLPFSTRPMMNPRWRFL